MSLNLKPQYPSQTSSKKEKLKNSFCITDVMLDNFTSFIKVTIVKKGINAVRLIVIILTDKAQHQELVNKVWSALRTKEEGDTPVFHNYNSAALLKQEKLRSLNIRNIPL